MTSIPLRLKPLGTNKTEVQLNDFLHVLFSYETPVAAWCSDKTRLDTETASALAAFPTNFIRTREKFSVTTTRHINSWLSGARALEVPQSILDNLCSRH